MEWVTNLENSGLFNSLTVAPLQKKTRYLDLSTRSAPPATDLCMETAPQPDARATEQANKRRHQFAQFRSLYARSFGSRQRGKIRIQAPHNSSVCCVDWGRVAS